MTNEATDLTSAVRDVLAERRRQVEVEGWTNRHDDEHTDGGMAFAAAAYAVHSASAAGPSMSASLWRWTGWATAWFKPKSPRADLVRATALLLAEIERRDRAAAAQKWQTCRRCENPTYCREQLRGCDLEEMAR